MRYKYRLSVYNIHSKVALFSGLNTGFWVISNIDPVASLQKRKGELKMLLHLILVTKQKKIQFRVKNSVISEKIAPLAFLQFDWLCFLENESLKCDWLFCLSFHSPWLEKNAIKS